MNEKSPFRRCGRDVVEFFNSTGWALLVVRRDKTSMIALRAHPWS
jgi:hypothetical protein